MDSSRQTFKYTVLSNQFMAIKKGDFVELEFIGRIKETNEIFDLTNEETAKKENMHNPKAKYGPKKICIGESQVVKGLDEALVGKELNKEYKVELTPEEGFGKKDAKLMKIIPTSVFTKQKVKPFPGLQVNIDNSMGTIKTVSGGRTVVDFNHPLAGRNVIYEFKILKEIKDDKDKLATLIGPVEEMTGVKVDIQLKDGEAIVKSELAELLEKTFKDKTKKLIPGIKKISFSKTETKS